MNSDTAETKESSFNLSNGLSIEFNEDSSTLEFNWNPKTNPEWNYLSELPEEEIRDRFIRFLKEVENSSEETNKDLFEHLRTPSNIQLEQTNDSN
jgi:hypothetical protein